jgi:hypothetical protein
LQKDHNDEPSGVLAEVVAVWNFMNWKMRILMIFLRISSKLERITMMLLANLGESARNQSEIGVASRITMGFSTRKSWWIPDEESARINSENGGFQLVNLMESAGYYSKIEEALIITMGASTGKSCGVPETIQKWGRLL